MGCFQAKEYFSTQTITNEEFSETITNEEFSETITENPIKPEHLDIMKTFYEKSAFLQSVSKHPFGLAHVQKLGRFIPRLMKLLEKLDKYTIKYTKKKTKFPHINALKTVLPTINHTALFFPNRKPRKIKNIKKKGQSKKR